MNDQEIIIIRELYLTNWDEAIVKSMSICDISEAKTLVISVISYQLSVPPT